MKVPLTRRIAWKIAGLTGLVGFTVTGIAAYLLLTDETRAFEQTTVNYLRLMTGMVQAAVPEPGPSGAHDWDRLFTSREPPFGVDRLQVFDASGKVVASIHPDDVGKPVPQELLDRLSGQEHALPKDSLALPKHMDLVDGIVATRGCSGACHASGAVLGGVYVRVRSDLLHDRVRRFRREAIFSWIGLLGGLLLLVVLLIQAFLGRPLEALTMVMEKVEAGDLLVRAQERGDDEIGQLARAFNKLLKKITDLRVDMLDASMELKSEISLKKQLETRSHELEDANRSLQDRVRDLSLLIEVSRVVNSSLELSRILQVFAERLAQALDIPRVAIALRRPGSEDLEVYAVHGFPEPERVMGVVFPKGKGIPWKAIERHLPVVVQDTREEPDVSYFQGRLREDGSLAAIPFTHSRDVMGVLILGRPDGSGFREDEVRLLQAMADQVAMAVANAQLHESARTQAITDPLTGLFNRRYMTHRLEMEWSRAKRFGHALSILMIDVDHFKEYNDRNGHLYGDRALQALAEILISNVRQVDTVARYGGEEFIILLPHTPLEGAINVAEKLRAAVAAHRFEVAGDPEGGRLTISVGVATLSGEDVDEAKRDERRATVEMVLSAADRALYRAKREGRDRVYVEHLSWLTPGEAKGRDTPRGGQTES